MKTNKGYLYLYLRQRTVSRFVKWIIPVLLLFCGLSIFTLWTNGVVVLLRSFNRTTRTQSIVQIVDYPVSVKNPELLLFTTTYKNEEKEKVADLIFELWNSWRPTIHPLMFTSDSDIVADTLRHDWTSLPEPRKNPDCFGPPLFPEMFKEAIQRYNATFYGFANADIAFDDGIYHTIKTLSQNKSLTEKPVLIIGKRIIFDFLKYGHLLHNPDDVSSLKDLGEEIHWSSDYWITTKSFPWYDILPVTVGRPFFDRWTMAFSIENANISVIDTSATIKAMHLTTQEGNFSSWIKPGKDCNVKIIMNGLPQVKEMGVGRPECASFETYWDDGEVRLREREPSRTECRPFYIPNKRQVWFLDPKLNASINQIQ